MAEYKFIRKSGVRPIDVGLVMTLEKNEVW